MLPDKSFYHNCAKEINLFHYTMLPHVVGVRNIRNDGGGNIPTAKARVIQ